MVNMNKCHALTVDSYESRVKVQKTEELYWLFGKELDFSFEYISIKIRLSLILLIAASPDNCSLFESNLRPIPARFRPECLITQNSNYDQLGNEIF